MYCVALIGRDGGTCACIGYSKADCYKKVQTVYDALLERGVSPYIATTVPYRPYLTQSKANKMRVEWNTDIPIDIKKSFGMELRLLLDSGISLED